MTNEMLLGGLMILTMVAGIVLVMTSKRNSGNGGFDGGSSPRRDHHPDGHSR